MTDGDLQAAEREILDRLDRSNRVWLAGVGPNGRKRIASRACYWVGCYHRHGIVNAKAMRSKVAEQMQAEFAEDYGSIWISIIFAIVWAIIQKKFFK